MTKTPQKTLLLASLALFLTLAAAGSSADAAEKEHVAKLTPAPNFVIFLTDDQGWGDLGCYGHPRIKSPNIDAFAKQGLRLTQCYAGSGVCSPSRSAIQTGRTPYRNGVYRWVPENSEVHLRSSEITIAKLLQDRGYATCHVGKWHLNGYFNSPKQPQPSDHGYDWWFATQNNAAPSHKNPRNFVRNGKAVGELKGFSAPLVVDEAIRWLKEERNDSKPFFLTVWTHEPHLPIESDPQFMQHYADLEEGKQQHHGNITQLDHAFGNLMRTLDELKVADNTMVIYTADNGPEGLGDRGRTRGSTGGLRGRKRAVYEGGIRVPGIIRWPGHIKPGTESDTPVIGSDIFATLCDVVDIPLPADRVIDGGSFLPMLQGKEITRARPLYWRCYLAPKPYQVAMRIGDWKILSDTKLERFELYNIQADAQEKNNLAETETARLEKMKAELTKLHKEIEAEGPDWWKRDPRG